MASKKKNRRNDVNMYRISDSSDSLGKLDPVVVATMSPMEQLYSSRITALEETIIQKAVLFEELQIEYTNVRSMKITAENELGRMRRGSIATALTDTPEIDFNTPESDKKPEEEYNMIRTKYNSLQSRFNDLELKLVEAKTENFRRGSTLLMSRKMSTMISPALSTASATIAESIEEEIGTSNEAMERMCAEFEEKLNQSENERHLINEENKRYVC